MLMLIHHPKYLHFHWLDQQYHYHQHSSPILIHQFQSIDLVNYLAVTVALNLSLSAAETDPIHNMTTAIANIAVASLLLFLIISPQVLANIKIKILYFN